MYDLPESYSFERAIKCVFNETVNTNGGKILFDIAKVDIKKAIQGQLVHNTDLVLKERLVTEFELQMLLRNETWFNNTIFHEGGEIIPLEELISKGIKLIK